MVLSFPSKTPPSMRPSAAYTMIQNTSLLTCQLTASRLPVPAVPRDWLVCVNGEEKRGRETISSSASHQAWLSTQAGWDQALLRHASVPAVRGPSVHRPTTAYATFPAGRPRKSRNGSSKRVNALAGPSSTILRPSAHDNKATPPAKGSRKNHACREKKQPPIPIPPPPPPTESPPPTFQPTPPPPSYASHSSPHSSTSSPSSDN